MKNHLPKILFVFIFSLFLNVADASAQTSKRVRFEPGAESAVVKGRIVGYSYVDYLLRVRSGQTISAQITTAGSAEIVVFAPSGENVGGDPIDFSALLEQTGDYKIRVLMPRAFARRKAASNYALKISVN